MIVQNNKIYFLSDFHLGSPDHATSLVREKLLVQFLEKIKDDAAEIFIVGDMFDFWYEYKKVVPKGYIRILGKLAELADAGIKLHFFVGNHDMWMRDYFEKEFQMKIYFNPEEFERNGKKFLIGHGDGVGPGDYGYKRLKKLFRNPVSKWLFGAVPPFFGVGLANYLSQRSRKKNGMVEEKFLGEEKEWIMIYCKEKLAQKKVDFFVFGHRHLPIDYRLDSTNSPGVHTGITARYINLGDWVWTCTYAVFDGNTMELKSFTGKEHKIIRN